MLLEVSADNTGALAFYAAEGFDARSTGAGATTATARTPVAARWSARQRRTPHDGPSRWCSASRPPATRPGSASCAATRCSPTRSPPASRSTPASAAWCPRSPRGRTSRRWCRRSSAPATTAGIRLADVDAIAVTSGPGSRRRAARRGRRRQGAGARRSASRSTASTTWPRTSPSTSSSTVRCPEPCVALLVSGGHSSLLLVERRHRRTCVPLGATIDDAAGEAFDKVARLLGLPFPGRPAHRPGGPRRASSVAIDFPRGLTSRRDLERHRFDFSFSGLKTAVARWVEAREAAGEPVPVADVAASFQEAVCDVLTRKAVRRRGERRRRGPADRRRGGGQLAAAGAGRGAGGRGRASGCGCPGPGCAPTTARWSPRWAPSWWPGAGSAVGARPPRGLLAAGHVRPRWLRSRPAAQVSSVPWSAGPWTTARN